MNIIDATILNLLTQDLPDSTEPLFKPYGIPMGSSAGCEVFLWLRFNQPEEISGIAVDHPRWKDNIHSTIVMSCGNGGEDGLERYIKNISAIKGSVVTFLGSQNKVRDLGGKWRGKLDYALHIDIPGIGALILDAKGMSERKFNEFVNSKSIKEFNEDYYCQILTYTHNMRSNRGGILAFNRSNGKLSIKTFSQEDTVEEFKFYRNRIKKVIEAKNIDELTPSWNKCKGCAFNKFCSTYYGSKFEGHIDV